MASNEPEYVSSLAFWRDMRSYFILATGSNFIQADFIQADFLHLKHSDNLVY